VLSTLDCYVAKAVDVNDYVRVLYNATGVSKGKDVASDDCNIVGGVSNCVVIDKEKCVDVDDEVLLK